MDLPGYFVQLYDYTFWANTRMLDAAEKLPPEQLFHEQGQSWGSVHAILVHMLSAEWIWLRRWLGESPKALLDPGDFPTWTGLRARWRDNEDELQRFVAGQSQGSLQRLVAYTNTKGMAYTLPLWQLMAHLANHDTHHRGELAAMFASLNAPHPEDDWYIYLLEAGQI